MRSISVLLLICIMAGCIVSCTENPSTGNPSESGTVDTGKDYAASVKLDPASGTAQQTVTVKAFIDGDTTHFNLKTPVNGSSVLKARYLAINTPESTGKIEEYGKTASEFTRSKLSGASSIVVESDTAGWDADSTGDRYLVWVWYRNSETEEYRNLNIEILQNGLAIASSSANNRYGSVCMDAINAAKTLKLNVYSGQKDPNFYYGGAVELTIKELRANIEEYKGMRVAFNGVVTINSDNGVYVEQYDAETDMYYGMYIYYGFNLSGDGLEIISVGNECRIVGSVQYWEGGASYQVADLRYRAMKPNDPENIQKLADGKTPAYKEITAEQFINGKILIAGEDKTEEYSFAELANGSSVSMKGLTVKSVYTTQSENGSSNGAMTLTCEVDGKTVSVRTIVLRDQDGNIITEDAYKGKTIDVKGIIDCYNGEYQIKVFSKDSITVK